MGIVSTIDHERFPDQGGWLNRRVAVCFHYNTADIVRGVIVRDDTEDPHVTIIRLDDGRYVLSTECQFSFD